MGKFVVSVRKNGEFQFNLLATNGQVILSSEGYTTKTACLNGIESVKKNAQVEARFEVKEAKNGKPFFNLKATNGQVILTSEGYVKKESCLNGIESVKKNAAIEERFEVKVAKNGKPFFNLKASNGQVIGSSQMYASERTMKQGIASVMKNAPEAPVIEEID